MIQHIPWSKRSYLHAMYNNMLKDGWESVVSTLNYVNRSEIFYIKIFNLFDLHGLLQTNGMDHFSQVFVLGSSWGRLPENFSCFPLQVVVFNLILF